MYLKLQEVMKNIVRDPILIGVARLSKLFLGFSGKVWPVSSETRNVTKIFKHLFLKSGFVFLPIRRIT
jgi:hypothetical protein